MTNITEYIQQSTDDAGDIGSPATFDSDNTGYDVVSSNTANKTIMGIRFQGVDIPNGATITAADLQFDYWSSCAARGGCSMNCYGIAIDDIATWTSGNRPKDATLTTNFGNFGSTGNSIPDYTSYTGHCHTSTSIPTCYLYQAVQEIVNRVGWVSGNDMGFIFKQLSVGIGNALTVFTWDYYDQFNIFTCTYVTAGVVHNLTLLGVGM